MSAALTLLLAGTLLAAGLAKLRDPAALAVLVGRVLGPRAPATQLSRALGVVEVALAVLLLSWVAPAPAAAAAGALLAGLSVALRVAARREPAALAACRCFGGAGDVPADQALVRNGGLIAAAAVVVLSPPDALSAIGAEDLAGAATVALGVALVWQLATLAWGLRPEPRA